MSGLRFKVGELALLAVSRSAYSESFVGSVGEIHMVGGTDNTDDPKDYGITFADKFPAAVMDWQLRKIDPPAEPASLTRESDVEVTA